MIGAFPGADPRLTGLDLKQRLEAADALNLWHPVDLPAIVYANWGMWVADCPNLCGGAEHYGAHPASGHIGGLTRTRFRCSKCFAETATVWPKERQRIEALLAARPSPANRNWWPSEPIDHLEEENIAARVQGLIP